MCKMDQRTNYLALILLDALEDENESDIHYILKHKQYVDAAYVPKERGIAPLHYVCGMKNERLAIEMAKRFLEMGSNPNVRSDDNMTPLHVAAMYGRIEIVKLLLVHGADVEVQDDEHKTPLLYAIDECHFDVVQLIRDHIFCKKFIKKTQLNAIDPSSISQFNCQSKNSDNERLINNKSFLQSQEQENNTPNRLEYNFDTASPYYINITHRRHKKQPKFPDLNKNKSQDMITTATAEKDISEMECVNIFKLTKENLDKYSRENKLRQSQTSIIKMWQEKVEKSRARQSLVKKFDNINEMIDEIIDNDHYNYNNIALNDNAYTTIAQSDKNYHTPINTIGKDNLVKEIEEEVKTPLKKKHMPLNKFVIEISKAKLIDIENESTVEMNKESTYETVPNAIVNEQEENADKIYKDKQYFLQMTESYEYTDDENGLVFYETKYIASRAFQQNEQQAVGTLNNKLISVPTEITADWNLNKSKTSVQTKGNITLPTDYDTDALRKELTIFGEPPGPITTTTKRLYIKKLIKYKRQLITAKASKDSLSQTINRFSVELQRTIKSKDHFEAIKDYNKYETQSVEYFANHNSNNNSKTTNAKKPMREGHLKQSFIYMLIDPRISCNLPGESLFLEQFDLWKRFLQSIFYVGKGKTSRPYSHLYDAMKSYSHLNYQELHKKSTITTSAGRASNGINKTANEVKKQVVAANDEKSNDNKNTMKTFDNNKSRKLQRILEIWNHGHGVVCLHIFHNITPIEAYTREAAIIEALSLQHLTNCKRGNYYGPAKTWTMKEKKYLGIALLYRAMLIYLAEGESQLSPCDLI